MLEERLRGSIVDFLFNVILSKGKKILLGKDLYDSFLLDTVVGYIIGIAVKVFALYFFLQDHDA